ncbi:hypothetical protein GGI02_003194 [Coemansia sp. RSA 2322]|nr:hypothetical protein GGI02_003194 [Coemansia sp. RSA 2322]
MAAGSRPVEIPAPGASPLPLPPSFCAFLQENHIDAAVYSNSCQLPRYVRILRYRRQSQTEIDALVRKIHADAGCRVSEVVGVPGFIEIANQSVRLSQLGAYINGDIAGMDVSSGIAAQALSVEPGHHVLDLCCAPGAKLLLLAELLSTTPASESMGSALVGTVTGVDIAQHRAATCRSLIKKHAGNNKGFMRIFVDDGTVFDSRAPQQGWQDPQLVREAMASASSLDGSSDRSARKSRRHRSAQPGQPWFAPKLLSTAYACSGTQLYDRVLVDAECTHDGSLVHLQKYARWGWDHLDTQVVGDDRSISVPILQSQLLENGWRLLKPGGVLVYSTCSLSRYQNEFVLGGFLARHAENEAIVEPIPAFSDSGVQSEDMSTSNIRRCGGILASPIWMPNCDDEWNRSGLDQHRAVFARMGHAARLDPMVSNTSGMFIARIKKLRQGAQPARPEAVPLALPQSIAHCGQAST